MHLMADAVAGAGMIHAAFGRDGLQIQVVVMVFRPELRHIMVNITDRQFRLHTGGSIDSNSKKAVVPVASCVSVWSMRMPMGWPCLSSPSIRCFWSILYVNVCAMRQPQSVILVFCFMRFINPQLPQKPPKNNDFHEKTETTSIKFYFPGCRSHYLTIEYKCPRVKGCNLLLYLAQEMKT
jgi:hypothetical protein